MIKRDFVIKVNEMAYPIEVGLLSSEAVMPSAEFGANEI